MPAVAERPTTPFEILVTPEDLLTMPGGAHLELVAGRLKKSEMGFWTSEVTAELQTRIRVFVREHGLGWAPAQECGYQCFSDDPLKVRKPDASFISYERIPADRGHEGHVRIPPALAAEVVSPNDVFQEVVGKAQEYITAGVRLVWVVAPANRLAMVFAPDRSPRLVTADEFLDGEPVLPGFRVRLTDLFPLPPASQA
jgi:Uma2 family endonuclease